ncbi:MAG TPA: calcium-binding protein [Coleofasciculaceae cyanobacterium]
MAKVPEDKEREERITMEIVVDAYDEEERAMGWYYYLQDTMQFPFDAIWTSSSKKSAKSSVREVEVIGMSDTDDCLSDMRVEVVYNNETFTARLSEIQPVDPDPDTEQAVGDWHYWISQGYQL